MVENRVDDEPHEKRSHGRHHASDSKGDKERGCTEDCATHQCDEANEESPSTALLQAVCDALHASAALVDAANFRQSGSCVAHDCV